MHGGHPVKKILIVEDDIKYRELLTNRLTMEQFAVLTASNGDEALSVLQTTPDIDLIILDIVMPHTDGVTFLYNVKQNVKGMIPVVILSNLTDTALPADESIREYLVKANTSLADVVTIVRKHCGI